MSEPETSTTQTSPVSELFQRDPLSLSEQDLDAIIEHYRNLRLVAKAEPKATSKKTKASDLGDLTL